MKKFIYACDSIYGNRSCIYHFINPQHITELHIEETQTERNIEATLIGGKRVIILFGSDLAELIGEEEAKEMIRKINYGNKTE